MRPKIELRMGGHRLDFSNVMVVMFFCDGFNFFETAALKLWEIANNTKSCQCGFWDPPKKSKMRS